MEFYFKGATLRRAPEVFQRRTSTLYHVGGHGARGQARIQLKAITREEIWMLVVVVFAFLSLDGLHAYSLDVWLLN